MKNVPKIIQRAETLLKEHPYDVGHDLEHHLEVWKLAQDIANHIEEKVDYDALQLAVMWHDVVTLEKFDNTFKDRDRITEKTADELEELLKKEKFTKSFISKVILAILHHGFEDQQVNTEGEILYDADKLSALDVTRWIKLFDAAKAGRLSPVSVEAYKKSGKKWISTMRGKLHFQYSKNLHDRMIKALLKDEKAIAIAKTAGWDLKSAGTKAVGL